MLAPRATRSPRGPAARGRRLLLQLAGREEISANALAVAVSLFLLVVHNASLWHTVARSLPSPMGLSGATMIAALFVALLALLCLLLGLFGVRGVFKPMLALLIVGAAVCSHFMDTYGVVIDREMLVNTMQTDRREAGELIGWRFAAHVGLLGVLPAIVVLRARIGWAPLLREAGRRIVLVVMAVAVAGGALFAEYKDLSLWIRQHREVRLFVNPTYPIYSVFEYLRGEDEDRSRPLQPVGADATRARAADAKRRLLVLVVGETAREGNFGVNGYRRDTTPELARIPGLISFTDVASCGTSTAESVPCMFSRLGRRSFSRKAAGRQENLLDVLQRTGVSVLWRDNNSGCKGVCARVPMQALDKETTPELCGTGECFDEILLRDLAGQLPGDGSDALIVLHQKGSHGPAYFRRYPDAYRRFVPDCRRDDVQTCPREEIVNAYDNTIAYTDHVLAGVVSALRSLGDGVDTAMLYVSDHGESLGENGIYLHGLPYAMAPEEQKHVPMVLWMSDGLRARLAVKPGCVEGKRAAELSHDNLFDTVLGFFDVRTAARRPELDLLEGCRVGSAGRAGSP